MAELIPSDSSNQIEFKRNNDNLNHYEPRLEDIADLRPWGTKKYDKAGGFADVSARDANRSQKKNNWHPGAENKLPVLAVSGRMPLTRHLVRANAFLT